MKIIISESKLNQIIFGFLDNYLKDFTVNDTPNIVSFGEKKQIQLAYEKGEKILYVRDELYDLVKNMFSLTNTSTKKIFKDYMESKGFRVKRMF